MTAAIVEEHHISGTSGGYNVRKEAVEAIKFYASNNASRNATVQALAGLPHHSGSSRAIPAKPT
ncbi:MAG: hypothetical protein ACXVZH_17005 [Terriglobales bacterium]